MFHLIFFSWCNTKARPDQTGSNIRTESGRKNEIWIGQRDLIILAGRLIIQGSLCADGIKTSHNKFKAVKKNIRARC